MGSVGWSDIEDSALRALWSRATRDAILATLPGRAWSHVVRRACVLALGGEYRDMDTSQRERARVAIEELIAKHGGVKAAALAAGISAREASRARNGRAPLRVCPAIVAAANGLAPVPPAPAKRRTPTFVCAWCGVRSAYVVRDEDGDWACSQECAGTLP